MLCAALYSAVLCRDGVGSVLDQQATALHCTALYRTVMIIETVRATAAGVM
jgi:hypothetical protein